MRDAPRIITRPLGPWTEPLTVDRPRSRFKATWRETLELLSREASMLGADLVVLQIDVTENDLRRDGNVRANARIDFPGVRVAFDSARGPLMFSSDAFGAGYDMPGWQSNVRAIALGLEALRAVDRYGITKRGEQYVGWQALTQTANGRPTREQAADLLAAGLDGFTAARLLADPEQVRLAHRILTRRHHPDRGGDPDLFARINVARDVLLAAP